MGSVFRYVPPVVCRLSSSPPQLTCENTRGGEEADARGVVLAPVGFRRSCRHVIAGRTAEAVWVVGSRVRVSLPADDAAVGGAWGCRWLCGVRLTSVLRASLLLASLSPLVYLSIVPSRRVRPPSSHASRGGEPAAAPLIP
jgi:hypothetical protein